MPIGNSEIFSKRLKQSMDIAGYKAFELVEAMKPKCDEAGIVIDKTQVSQYLHAKNFPNSKRLLIMAETLGVNEAWLSGFDVPRKREGASDADADFELIELASHLTNENREKVISYIRFLISTQ